MRKLSRGIALLLCVVMIVGMLPAVSLAAEPTLISEKPIEHPEIPIYENPEYSFAERAADLVARMTPAQKGSQMISSPAPAISAKNLGGGALKTTATKDLPQYYWWNEGLHGYNRIDNGAGVSGGGAGPGNAVSYPQSLTVGSTWNPELYYTEALQVSDEIRERTSRSPQTGNAINLNFYSPTVNLQRDPRWGRNEESYSEDPYLTVKMGSQYVLGLEGKNQDGSMIDPDGYYKVHSTIKHFVANNSESNRLNGGATTDLAALRNYYLAPYRDIIQATDVSSVMTAYSSLNTEPCSFSSYLMDTILRQTYGLSGHITSDCDSVGTMSRLNYRNPRTGATLTNVERLAGALAHGEDLECNGGYQGTGNYNSYSSQMLSGNVQTDKGLFTENTMDISLHRLLTARISTGEFEDDLALTKAANDRIAAQKAATSSSVYNQTKERLDIVDAVNNEGVVMLQNKDNFLPLNIPASGAYNVVIVGAWQTNMYLGLYSANENNTENQINIQKGLTNAIKAVNPDATFTYLTSDSVSSGNQAAIEAADVCFVVGGANNSYSAEDRDRSSLALSNNQATMFAQVGQWNPNTVAIMETCGPMETYTFSDNVKAILWSSFGGLHKGVGFGNIVTGKVNPSGKVTATWYKTASELPDKTNYNMYATGGSKGRTYMYYTGDAVYPFGYGLSFTTYEYSNLKIDKTAYDANDTVKVTFDVKNTGKMAGKEVTQLYIAQPDAPAALNRPIRRLEGFEKVSLEPGEKKTVSMEVSIPDLAFYDEADDCFKVDTGKYQVQVGKDSASADLTADFTVSGAMDVYPTVLTVKANAVGDTANGIEERLIYAKGDVINPQLTVAMNNEKLYGYIIADQQSPIKSLKSCPLPEGMTFEYSSNRSSVAKVENGVIKAVGPGVATITVTGELDGVEVSNDFVVYVEASAKLDGILVNGEPLAKFSPDTFSYRMTLEAKAKMPTVEAIAKEGLETKVEMPEALPGTVIITSTDPTSGISEIYKLDLKKKAASSSSVDIDFTDPSSASDFEILNQKNAAIAEGTGLKLTATKHAFEPSNGQLSGDAATVPEDVVSVPVSGDWTATLEVDFATGSARNGYYQFFGFYAAEGDDFQNLAGVRGGDGNMQNFTRENGTVTAETQTVTPGFASAGTYFFQIEKAADTYVVSRSSDGVDFEPIFTYEATGMEADSIIIDAYTGMTEGYEFTLKNLNIEVVSQGLPSIDFTTEADSDKYEIVNQTSAAVAEGTGLKLTATKHAFEPSNGQLSGDAATVPADVVMVPVAGDWTATLELDFATGSARNGYYQFFGFYAAEGDDFQNLAGVRGGDGNMQNFTRENGTITAETQTVTPGFASAGTYFFQIEKSGDTYIVSRSSDGIDFEPIFTYEATGMEADFIVIDAYTGMTEGYEFTLKSLTFEGGGAPVVKEKPEIASILVDGQDIGFEAGTKVYNVQVEKGAKAPVIEATAANKSTVVEIQQLDGPTGVAVVTGTVENKSVTYKIAFNYGPVDDYFADGDFSDAWTVERELKDEYQIVKGEGLKLYTQVQDYYQDGSEWHNAFTMPAQGNWTAVAKAFYPTTALETYQQLTMAVWQDEDNYVRICCQESRLYIEPGQEVNGTMDLSQFQNATAVAAEDGTVTIYFRIDKVGNKYTVSWSQDGTTFASLGSVTADYADPKIVLTGGQNSDNTPVWLNYEYLAISSRDGVDANSDFLTWACQNVADYVAADLPEEASESFAFSAIPHGYTLKVESSDPAVIAADGTVTPAAKDAKVDLTITVSDGATSATATKSVTVPGTEPEEPVVMHTVTFNYNYPGCPDPVVVQVKDGATVEPIEAPARTGYKFNAWGTMSTGWFARFTAYDFTKPVTADLSLTANWTKDWSQMYSLAEEYKDFFPFGNFGTMSPSGDQVTYEYNTYSGNSGKMTYNFGANESKNAYNAAVAEINADTTLTEEEKAAKILEAEGKVYLGANNPLESSLNAIQKWNEEHPEGPKKYYRQHVIAWHGSEQNAAFYHEGFDTSKPLASKEVMNARLDSYIEAMFKRYQPWDDIILSWDIVNEALDDYNGMVRNGWNGTSWGETKLDDASNQSSAWGTIYRMKDENGNPVMETSDERLLYESEWIRVAFASARKWQQELGVHWTLYYNDYMNSSMLYEPKMTNTLKMLKPIAEAGNLDGYGMQARLATAYPGIELLRTQIEEGLKLAPEVSFSEGDVRTDFEVNPLYDPEKPTRRVVEGDEEWDEGGSGSYSRRSQQNGNTYDVSNGPVRRKANFNANDPETMRIQADYYADLMDIMVEKAAEGKVGAVAIDGTSDSNTFNRSTGCQIWDSNGNEKPAFFAIIGAPNRFKMGQAIEAGPAASEKSKYTAASWAVYAAALDAAEALVDVRIYDADGVEAVKAATVKLNAAIEGLVEASGEPSSVSYIAADTIEAGKSYVIVSNGYALTNKSAAVTTASGGQSLASTPVIVENDEIISEVSPEMVWDFKTGVNTPETTYTTGYFVTNGDSKFLARASSGQGAMAAPLNTNTYDDSNYDTKPHYCYWVVLDLDEEGNKAMFVVGPGSNEYAFLLRGSSEGFDAPGGGSKSSIDSFKNQYPVQLYEVVEGPANTDIDFTNPADASKFEVIGKDSAEIAEGEGLALVTTKDAYEPAGNQLSGDAAITPKDAIKVPVSGDWTATLEFDADLSGANNGYYQFFGFVASEGDDYQNMAGIRGGDGAMQNFLRVGGELTADTAELNSTPGIASNGTYWYQIKKDGTTYTCSRSADGVDFTEMFTYEDTGIEADSILIDAYTGMTAGYKFILKSLTFGDAPVGPEPGCDHDYEVIEALPTCTEAGSITYVCSKCGDSYVEEGAPALGHDYKAVVTAPTCEDAGYTTYVCARCSDSYVADEVDALGHSYVNGVCERCGAVDPGYTPSDIDDIVRLAQAAAKAAENAKKAAEAAQAAAEEAKANAGSDKSAAEAAQKAAEAAQKAAEAAQKAAESAQKAAEASDAEAAKSAAASAADSAAAAASAAEAAKAQAAASQAMNKAETAAEAAKEAVEKAEKAAEQGEAAVEPAKDAAEAAEAAQKAAEDAEAAAAKAKAAADKSNAQAAEAAAKAAENAAKIADAQKEVAAAKAQAAELAAQAAKDADDAEKAKEAAEAAQKAAEEAAKAAKAYELDAAKTAALVALATAAPAGSDLTDAIAAIDAAETPEDVKKALDEALAALAAECPSAKFSDAPAKGNWAHEGIDFCIANDYMNGTADNVFSPDGTVTRAQLVTILYRVAGEPATEFKGTFSDVADGQWYSAAIEWAAANGVVNGVGEGKFAPDGEITREQIATILFRYSKAAKVEGDLKAFPDGDTAGDFAIDGLVWAVSEGLITGVKNGDVTTLAPKDNATRAQIAAIIMRFLDGSYDCE